MIINFNFWLFFFKILAAQFENQYIFNSILTFANILEMNGELAIGVIFCWQARVTDRYESVEFYFDFRIGSLAILFLCE